MFSLQPKDELVFGTPIISQEDKIPEDLIPDHANNFLESNIINFSTGTNYNTGQNQFGFEERERGIKDECSIRKVMHRDIERKRRQEMSKLYSSLRSLLPVEHIQGKRSTCDHMLEAVNYIKQLQKNIQELKIRRDKLKNLSNISAKKAASSNCSDNLQNCVTVNPVRDGVEILIIENSEFGLSKVLAELLERRLNVISCVSTKIEGRFLHRIQSRASDVKSLDLAVLQERLANIVN